jgi:hypothetical protein
LGGTTAANVGQAINIHDLPGPSVGPFSVTRDNHLQFSGTPDPQVLGGLKLGTWFVKEGFAGWSGYPDWMKYFGFYTDLNFQKFEMRAPINGTLNYKISFTPMDDSADPTFNVAKLNSGEFRADGSILTWAFMFAARYGFLPDAEVPFGRLQPYVAVGPAIMFSEMEAKAITISRLGPILPPIGIPGSQIGGVNQGAINIALEAESGIRYMCTKNISVELSFKYRYARPTYDYTATDGALLTANPATYKFSPVYNLFSGQLGVAYHF